MARLSCSYFVTEDLDGNLGTTVYERLVEFPDNLPPRFIQTFPRTSLVRDNDFYVAVMLTEPGKVYVLVTDRNDADPTDEDIDGGTGQDLGANNTASTQPSIADIKAGNVGTTGRLVVAAGTIEVPQANMAYVVLWRHTCVRYRGRLRLQLT